MHIYQTVINRLEKDHVPLTQEDKGKVQAYFNDLRDDGIVNTIEYHMTNWPDGYVPGIYAFLYEKQGIDALLKIIGDKDKFQENIVKKVENYKTKLHKDDLQYLNKNYKEFIEYNTFISDPSKPHGGHKTHFQNWVLAYNNTLIVKELGYGSIFHNWQEYNIDQYGSFGYVLNGLKKTVNDYAKSKGYDTGLGVNIINNQCDEKDDRQMSEEPHSLLQLAKVAIIKAAVNSQRR